MNAQENQTYLATLKEWGVLRLTGTERKSFLHGMVSNEVNGLAPGQGSYNTILTAKGKIIADLWVFDADESLVLLCKANLAETVAQALDKYLIMEDVTITDETSQWNLIGLLGEHASEIAHSVVGSAPQEPLRMTTIEAPQKALAFTVPITGVEGIVLAYSDAASLSEALINEGVAQISPEALEELRITKGEPACGHELTEDVIPQEAILHHAISYEKGCYIGQETVARLHFRGHVNRELTGFTLTAMPPEGEVLLFDGEKKVGRITSAVQSQDGSSILALGYLRCAQREVGKTLEARIDDHTFEATVRPIPESEPQKPA